MDVLFNPYKLNQAVTLRNRIVMAPMTTYSSNPDLTLSDEEEQYYEARSKEVGIVITAACAINKDAQAFENQISIRDNRYLESMTRLANAIKKGGAKAVLQIHHGGRMNVPNQYPNQDIVSASAVKANREYAVTPRELKTSEVYDIVDDFTRATKIAMQAGFDGVEYHGANTYLIQQFFSPHSNKRTDEFGGSMQKRLLFPSLLLDRAILLRKNYKKDDFIIGYRFSPEELEEPGIDLKQTTYLVNKLAQKDIDYLHISLSSYDQTSLRDKDSTIPIIKSIIDTINGRVPFIVSGNLDTLSKLQEARKLGSDLFAIGMPILSDVNAVRHLMNNEPINKVITNKNILPTPLYNRLKQWKGIEEKGYKVK